MLRRPRAIIESWRWGEDFSGGRQTLVTAFLDRSTYVRAFVQKEVTSVQQSSGKTVEQQLMQQSLSSILQFAMRLMKGLLISTLAAAFFAWVFQPPLLHHLIVRLVFVLQVDSSLPVFWMPLHAESMCLSFIQ